MKCACLLFKNDKTMLSKRETALLDCLSAQGYAIEETRVLYTANEEKIVAILTEYKTQFETVFAFADEKSMAYIKALILSLYSDEKQSRLNGTGIYTDKEKTLCFMPLNYSAETGEFVLSACVPYLTKMQNKRTDKFVVRTVGANDLRVEQLISRIEMLACNKLTITRSRAFDEDIIRVFYDETTPKMLIDDALRILAEGLQDCVYALEDCALETQLVQLLKLRSRKISVAESFTGGGLAQRITSVSGASAVYFEGVNTYNELSKIKRLGVREYTLRTLGAVSDQTAYEMAAGLIATGDCDLAIATTGLAGPNTDKSGLPVGLCYIAIGTKESVTVYRYKFDGTREDITKKAINYALFLAYKQLKND